MKAQIMLPSCRAEKYGTDCREAIGYVRSFDGEGSCRIQEQMIESYCMHNRISCTRIYSDGGCHRRTSGEKWRAGMLGISDSKCLLTFPEWEEMLLYISQGKVGNLLVESRFRLMSSKEQNEAFSRICREWQVEIIEVVPDLGDGQRACRIGVYHYTDESEVRPRVVCSEVDRLYRFIEEKGWGSPALFLDTSLRKGKNCRYSELLLHAGDGAFDAILVHSFYHLETKTGMFWNVAAELLPKGVTMVSRMEGSLKLFPGEVLEQTLKVALYDRCRSKAEQEHSELFRERARLFVRYKAPRWSIEGTYMDLGEKSETALDRLKEENERYDLVLIDMLGKVCGRTNRFMKIWKEIGRPFYSLKEGGVCLEGEGALL